MSVVVVNQTDTDDTATDGFDAFYAERLAPLTRLAFLLTGSASAADEIAQEALERVLVKWSGIDNPGGYARVVVVNGSRSWLRRRGVAERVRYDVPADAELDTDAIAVRSVLKRLPESEREVLVLRFFADLTVEEIALAVDRPAGTVKSLIHRTLTKLRTELS